MSRDMEFLVDFSVGSVLMLLILVVSDWLTERKFNRELRKSKESR
jgi:hypothetical protein